MHLRAKLTWVTVTVLALGAEASAAAQSAPARATSSADGTTPPDSQAVAVGPQLKAARASLTGKANSRDSSAAIDWNALASRQAMNDKTAGNSLPMPGSGGAPIASSAGSTDITQLHPASATNQAGTTAGAATRVVPAGDAPAASAPASAPAAHPEAVIRGQVNPAARACYENDPASKSKPPGKLVILIALKPSGDVDSVTVANNAGVAPGVASCISAAAQATKFAPPGANAGTVRAAFAFPAPEVRASR